VSPTLLVAILPALAAFGVALATAPAWDRRLRGQGWIDIPRPQRHAKRPVSRAGGAAWLSGLLAGIAVGIVMTAGALGRGGRPGDLDPAGALTVWTSGRFLTAVVPSGIVGMVAVLAFFLGRLDDRELFRPGQKWVLQVVILAGGMLGLLFGPGPRSSLPAVGTGAGPVAACTASSFFPLAVVFSVGVVLQVALEILDHLDGLLAVHAMAGAAALALAAGPGWARDAGLAGCGASLGFLCWNRPPARLYLGNGGSLAVATVLPLLLMALATNGAGGIIRDFGRVGDSGGFGPDRMQGAAGLPPWRFAAVLPVFAWPILDLLVVTGARLCRGDPPWKGGCDHLAHRVARRFGSDRASFAAGAVAAAAGFLLAATGLR
jgi:UDP-GlcNAc:undecaprenyl-phosphate GlcNAc-1-phosphate transferase